MEEQWLEQVAGGQMEALGQLYTVWRVPVYAFLLSLVQNRALAGDLTQDAFVHAYQKAYLYKRGTSPRSWMFTIARNLGYDALRRGKRIRLVSDEEHVLLTAASNEQHIVARLDAMEQLSRLTEQEREIVVLKAFHLFTHQEIAEIVQLPVGTVKWKYRKALQQLEHTIGGGHDDGS